jgi:hypothetical protein
MANTRSSCPNEDELLFCEDGQNSFVVLETGGPEPTLTATVYGGNRDELFSHTWQRSELE